MKLLVTSSSLRYLWNEKHFVSSQKMKKQKGESLLLLMGLFLTWAIARSFHSIPLKRQEESLLSNMPRWGDVCTTLNFYFYAVRVNLISLSLFTGGEKRDWVVGPLLRGFGSRVVRIRHHRNLARFSGACFSFVCLSLSLFHSGSLSLSL